MDNRSELLSRILQQMNYRQATAQPRTYGALAGHLGAQLADAFNYKNQLKQRQQGQMADSQGLAKALGDYTQTQQGGMQRLPGTGVQLDTLPDQQGAQQGLVQALAGNQDPMAQAAMGQMMSQQLAPPREPKIERVDVGDKILVLRDGIPVGAMPKGATPDATMKEGGDDRRFMEGQDRQDSRLGFTEGNAFKRLRMQLDANKENAGVSNDQQRIKNEHLLRGEFNSLPEVTSYKSVLPMVKSIQSAPDTPAGDLDYTYAIAKILDPGSAVKEGEQTLVFNAGSPLSKIFGKSRVTFAGRGQITPEMRQQLNSMVENRLSQLKTMHDSAYDRYSALGARMNSNPTDIVGQRPEEAFAPKSGATQKSPPDYVYVPGKGLVKQ